MRRFCKIATRLRSTTGTQRQFLDVDKVGQKVCYIKRRQSHKKEKDRDGPFMGFVFDELPSGFVCLGREQVNYHEKTNLLKILMSKFLRLADETQDEELFFLAGLKIAYCHAIL